MGKRGYFLGGKADGEWNWPPSSVEIKNGRAVSPLHHTSFGRGA
jgi:hypothetical protein